MVRGSSPRSVTEAPARRGFVVILSCWTCADHDTLLAGWTFTYDGDGNRVKQVYTNGTCNFTTYYFFGGAYEVQSDWTTVTTRKYYAFAGMTLAMDDGSGLQYFLTDHLGSVVEVTDSFRWHLKKSKQTIKIGFTGLLERNQVPIYFS